MLRKKTFCASGIFTAYPQRWKENSSAVSYFHVSNGKCFDNALLNVNCTKWDFF